MTPTASRDRRFERLLLRFYGPADVADPDAPARAVRVPPDVCGSCGRDLNTEHLVTRDPVLGSVLSCPPPDPA